MDRQQIEKELELRTSRASGAGGQHVNKTESRVELVLNVRDSQGLSRREKSNLNYHLASRLQNDRLSVVDQSGRSQHTNRKRALAQLFQLLERGTKNIPKKHKGGAFTAGRKKRLENKRRRSEIKAKRTKPRF